MVPEGHMSSRAAREDAPERRWPATGRRRSAPRDRRRPPWLRLLSALCLALVAVIGAGVVAPALGVAPSLAAIDRAARPALAPQTASPTAEQAQCRLGATPGSDRPDAEEADLDDDDLDDEDAQASRALPHDVSALSRNAGPLARGARDDAERRGDPSRFAIATDLARGPPA